jgi:hypothetical protein
MKRGNKHAVRATLCNAIAMLCLSILWGCDRFNRSLTTGLEEEKSYTRHAMEYHRQHPNKRHSGVLDAWSESDYIAVAVVKQNLDGQWVQQSNQLPFLENSLKLDTDGRPFCVAQRTDSVIVLRFWDKTKMDCTLNSANKIDTSHINSGDMEFSGRTDFWIYMLKTTNQR